jgi:signal transduction histidine kinase
MLADTDYAALVLDLGLPKRSGLEVLGRLRQHGSHLPVLILTARDTVEDRIAGLDRGSDGYLVKPFDFGERAESRQDLAEEIAFGLLTPLLWALLLLAVLVWWAITPALRPLAELGEQIARRSADRFDPLPVDAVPSEAAPLVERLNALLQRVDSAPPPRNASPATRRTNCGRRLRHCRHRRRWRWPKTPRRSARTPCARCCWRPGGWPAILLRNLIDNAVRHSPQSGVVRIFLQTGAGRVRLQVIDHGPGVPVVQLPRLGQRFWRGEGDASPAPTGSGLGLSIVRRIGELHAATVSFDLTDGGGLRVSVHFPPA